MCTCAIHSIFRIYNSISTTSALAPQGIILELFSEQLTKLLSLNRAKSTGFTMIPVSVQGNGVNIVHYKKRDEDWVFSEAPEDWDPRGEVREVRPPQAEPAKVVIDGLGDREQGGRGREAALRDASRATGDARLQRQEWRVLSLQVHLR